MFARTNNDFVLKGDYKIGQRFTYDTQTHGDHLDEVELIGETLRDIVKVGDLVCYYWKNRRKHTHWIIRMTEDNIEEFKNYKNVKVSKIYVPSGPTVSVESKPKEHVEEHTLWIHWGD